MSVVYKYPVLPDNKVQYMDFPASSQILSAIEQNGEIVRLQNDLGALPFPLQEDVDYKVANAAANTMQLVNLNTGLIVGIVDAGSGYNQIRQDWDFQAGWTVQASSGGATNRFGAPVNPGFFGMAVGPGFYCAALIVQGGPIIFGIDVTTYPT